MVTRYYGRLLAAPTGSFFLFGVRGSGKSSWVKRLNRPLHEFNLLREGLYQSYLARPDLFRAALAKIARDRTGAQRDTWVFVDEVQRVPFLLNEVHSAMEEFGLKFILTGSSARKLKRGGANLLGGRALVKNLYPLLPSELGEDFDLEEILHYGSIPVILSGACSERKDRLRAYVETYLKEEVQAEALVRKLSGFLRFLPIAGLFHGQIINVSNIARDCGVERTTVAGYLDILQDTLVTFHLPAFEAKLRVRERKHPKLFWVDPGLARAARGDFGPLAAEERGALFEGWIAQTLRSSQSYLDDWEEMSYWAPTEAKGVEVDFLLRRGRSYTAIEAKSGARFRPEWLKGLKAIADLKGLKRRILVYPGNQSHLAEDGIEILTVEDFLAEIQLRRLIG